jgi:hypothetical protein
MGEEAMKDKYYYKDGSTSSKYDDSKVLHRVDGPAIEYADGDKIWYIDGQCHREDGPAVENANGNKWWWVNDRRHRIDGPACEWAIGNREWWVDGEFYTEEEFNKLINEAKQLPLALRLIDPREWVRLMKTR